MNSRAVNDHLALAYQGVLWERDHQEPFVRIRIENLSLLEREVLVIDNEQVLVVGNEDAPEEAEQRDYSTTSSSITTNCDRVSKDQRNESSITHYNEGIDSYDCTISGTAVFGRTGVNIENIVFVPNDYTFDGKSIWDTPHCIRIASVSTISPNNSNDTISSVEAKAPNKNADFLSVYSNYPTNYTLRLSREQKNTFNHRHDRSNAKHIEKYYREINRKGRKLINVDQKGIDKESSSNGRK
jgi:hypothetical protein